MNTKAPVYSVSLFLAIFLLVAETTLAKPKAFNVERYERNRMFLPDHENPEAIREIVERQSPATLIARNLCFGSRDTPLGSFRILQAGRLGILRVDYAPSLPAGETKVLQLLDENLHVVNPEYTTSDNIHFDFRFDNNPLEVSANQIFKLYEGHPARVAFCVDVYGYYAN